MNRGVLALMIAGFVGFGAGAWIAATGSRELGISLMAMGLIFQVLTLRQLKVARTNGQEKGQEKGHGDAG